MEGEIVDACNTTHGLHSLTPTTNTRSQHDRDDIPGTMGAYQHRTPRGAPGTTAGIPISVEEARRAGPFRVSGPSAQQALAGEPLRGHVLGLLAIHVDLRVEVGDHLVGQRRADRRHDVGDGRELVQGLLAQGQYPAVLDEEALVVLEHGEVCLLY